MSKPRKSPVRKKSGPSQSTTALRIPRTEKTPLRLGISLGDPAGVGPEVTLRAMLAFHEEARDAGTPLPFIPLLIGPLWVYENTAKRLRLPVRFREVSAEDPAADTLDRSGAPPTLDVLPPIGSPASFALPWGREDVRCGALARQAIETGAGLALAGRTDALVTAPICKASIQAAGSPFPGHTEMLQSLCGAPRVGMMLAAGGLRVSLVTIHEPLADVPRLITPERVFAMIHLTADFLRAWDRPTPRLALAALNPHAGEGGLFGGEEARLLAPALRRARRARIAIEGPLPSDTVFHFALQGRFDAVVCLYHDQALIPVKTLDFDGGVNITMGLPIVRTSPDHGTAFAIAGKGEASPRSMIAAIRTAIELARARRRETGA